MLTGRIFLIVSKSQAWRDNPSSHSLSSSDQCSKPLIIWNHLLDSFQDSKESLVLGSSVGCRTPDGSSPRLRRGEESPPSSGGCCLPSAAQEGVWLIAGSWWAWHPLWPTGPFLQTRFPDLLPLLNFRRLVSGKTAPCSTQRGNWGAKHQCGTCGGDGTPEKNWYLLD